MPARSQTESAGLLAEAVRATVGGGSARIRTASTFAGLAPEPDDTVGDGIVDFKSDRVWLTGPRVSRGSVRRFRSLTEEVSKRAGQRKIPVLKRLYASYMDQASKRSRQWYFDGMTRYKRKRNGRWSDGFPLRWSAGEHEHTRETEHPLWLLAPLSNFQGEAREVGHGELIEGAATTRYSLELTEAEISAAAWDGLAHPDSSGSDVPMRWWEAPPRSMARTAISAQVWLDDKEHIRRMSFVRDAWHLSIDGQEEPDLLWSVTELWDYGVEVNRQPPTGSA